MTFVVDASAVLQALAPDEAGDMGAEVLGRIELTGAIAPQAFAGDAGLARGLARAEVGDAEVEEIPGEVDVAGEFVRIVGIGGILADRPAEADHHGREQDHAEEG